MKEKSCLSSTTQVNSTFQARWLASSEVISRVPFTSEQPKKNQNGFRRYIFTDKVNLLVASYSACVVHTKTIIQLSVGESFEQINSSHHLARKYARIFVRGHYLFREMKTVSYEEQIMSKDKYPSIFSPQMATIVSIILQIFFATRAVLKIGEYSLTFPSFSWGIFDHVTCLN